MDERRQEDLVKRFEVRERRHAQTTAIGVGAGVMLSLVLVALAWRSTNETALKQAQVDTLSTKFSRVTAVKDSLTRVLALRDSSMALANAGAVLAMSGRVDDAHAQYRAAIAIDSTNWAAWDFEGTLYRRTNPSKAIPLLRRSIALNPTNEWAYYNLSIALWKSGEHDAALDSLKRVIELVPEMRATILGDEQFREFRSSARFRTLMNL